MRYKIEDKLIKSENAAKSNKQQSLFLKNLLKQENQHLLVMDYGCGKLRYAEPLRMISINQIFVDSLVQLQRQQIIHGDRTNILNYTRANYINSICYTPENIDHAEFKCDFILCSNVLSAIPDKRERDKSVRRIKHCLKKKGKALFVIQYKDQFFEDLKNRDGAIKHLDGYIVNSGNNFSYYGVLNPEKLKEILEFNGMNVLKEITNKGSVYIYAN